MKPGPDQTHSTHNRKLEPFYRHYRECATCHEGIPYGHYSASCSECYHNECLKCSSKNRINRQVSLMVHDHSLVSHSSYERKILGLYSSDFCYCNICRIKVSGGVTYTCILCNFDACLSCYKKILPIGQGFSKDLNITKKSTYLSKVKLRSKTSAF